MDLVNQILRLSRRAGGGHPQRLVEAAVRASRCEEIGVLDLAKAPRLREGDGRFQRLAEAAARGFETPWSSSSSTLPPPTASSTLPPPPSSSSSSVIGVLDLVKALHLREGDGHIQRQAEAAARRFETPSSSLSSTLPPPTSSSALNSPSWKPSRSVSWSWKLPSKTSLSTRGMTSSLRCHGYLARGMSSALHTCGYSSTWLLPQDVENLPKLPPVSELSYDRVDSKPEIWVPILEFFKLHHEPFPDPPADGSCARSLSTDLYREIQRDLLKIVTVNKKRGYDLSDDLKPQNVLVCLATGRIKLGVVSGNLITNPVEFKGYVVAGLLFDNILFILYNGSKFISEDNALFHTLLSWCLEDQMILNDACLLKRSGRLGLSLKISMLLENDLPKLVKNCSGYDRYLFYQSLPYTSDVLDVFPTDSMHPSFQAWRQESGEFKDQDRTFERANLRNDNKDPRLAWLYLTGKWLVRLNGNFVMHPPRGFKQWQAIDLMHSHTPLYLQKAQESFWKKKDWWEKLEMRNYFPEKK